MKSNVKRFLALMTVATMVLTPMTAFADTPTTSTSTSGGHLELDDSEAPYFQGIILPTVADNAYDFIIDPEEKLHEYRGETFTNTNMGIYFRSSATPGAIALAGDTNPVYATVKTEASITDLENALTVTGGSITAITNSSIYYVWTPESNGAVTGKYVALSTSSAIKQYFDITYAATRASLTFKSRIGEATTDEKVYTDADIPLAPGTYDPSKYVVINTANAITGFQPNVSLKAGSPASIYTATSAGAFTIATSGAVSVWNNTSEKLKVVNRSSDKITISVDVTLNLASPGGLVYADTFSAVRSMTSAAISMKINAKDSANVSTSSAITAVSGGVIKGTYTKDLEAASGSSIHYITGNPDPNKGTLSDTFKQYEAANYTYDEVDLYIVADVSRDSDDAVAAWKAYSKALKDHSATLPVITVVFSFDTWEEPEEEETPLTDGGTYTAAWNNYYRSYVVESSYTHLTEEDFAAATALYYSNDLETWGDATSSMSTRVSSDGQYGTVKIGQDQWKVDGTDQKYWKLVIGSTYYIFEMPW